MVSGSKKAGEAIGCTGDSTNVVAVVLDHGTVGLGPLEDASSLFRSPVPVPEHHPYPFVLGDDIHVRDSLDVAEGEAVVGTLADWQ